MNLPAVRALRLVSERTQSELLDTVQLAWSRWASSFLPQATTWTPTFEVQPMAETALPPPDGEWQAHGEHALAGWSQWTARGRQQLAARLVQRAPTAPALPDNDWALAAADHAWSELNKQLLGPTLPPTEVAMASPDTRPWSGVVFISEPILEARWAWRLPPLSAAESPDVTIRRSAIDCVNHRTLRLQAELGEVDITLADLLALQVGDVVCFPSGQVQGVPFKLGDKAHAAGHGQLGLIDGRLALRLSAQSPILS